jgi:hypothetical protein
MGIEERHKPVLEIILIAAMVLYRSPEHFMNHQTKSMIHRKGEGGE